MMRTSGILVYILIYMRMLVTEGQILVQSQTVRAVSVDSTCKTIYGSTFGEYTPSTNHDVVILIDQLATNGVTGDVWIKSTYDTTAVQLSQAFSWTTEPVNGNSLWFVGGGVRREPDDWSEQCTVLRKRFITLTSSTGKHMLGNKGCSGSYAMFYCIESTPPTTTSTTTTTTPTTTTMPTTTTTTPTTTTTTTTPTTTSTTPTTTSTSTTPTTSTTTKTQSTTSTTTTTTDPALPSATTHSTNIVDLTTLDTVPVNLCPCRCGHNTSQYTNLSTLEIQELSNQIHRKLTLDPQTLSLTKRKKISVADNRPTSKSFGVAAIVTLAVVYGALVILDLNRVFTFFVKNHAEKTKSVEPLRKANKK